MTTNKSQTRSRGERGRSRRMILEEGGGILASLSNFDDVDNNKMRKHNNNSQRRSVSKKMPPPRTLIISKACSDDEKEDSTSYNVENDVSALESPSLQPRRLLDRSDEHSDSSSSCSEDGDETSEEEEEEEDDSDVDSESSDEEEASDESEGDHDDDDDDDDSDDSAASEDDEELVADEEESHVAQVNEDDIEIENEDPTEESDYDPDDEGFETEDDEELEADDDSDDERRVSRVQQKNVNLTIEKKEPTTVNVEANNVESNETVSDVDVSADTTEESDQDDEVEEAIAEIVEDSACEDSGVDTSSPNKAENAAKQDDNEVQACTVVEKDIAHGEKDTAEPPQESDSVSSILSDSFPTVQSIECQAGSPLEWPQVEKGKSSIDNHDESILKMVLKQGDLREGGLFSSISSHSDFGADSSPGADHSNEQKNIRSEKENGSSDIGADSFPGADYSNARKSTVLEKENDSPLQKESAQSKPIKILSEFQSTVEPITVESVIASAAGASTIPETRQEEMEPLDFTVPTEKMGGLSITEKRITNGSGNASNTQAPFKSKNRRLRREGSVKRGQWKLGSKIGSGAFGVVHVGLNTRAGTMMAVKSIKMEKAVMKDVRVEIDLLRSLDHTNIVRYLGAQMDEKYLHIFQEWVPGGSLTSLLSKFGAFSMAVVRNYFSQILEGLAYLHEQNIMHRDLKGSNVLVSDSGVVKLADFGASKKFESLKHDMMLSLTMRGTPYFMAPEVFEEKYSTKADIWSVGCIAIQMATGSAPWKGLGMTNPVALFNHVKRTEGLPEADFPVPESDYVRNELGKFKKLLMRCFPRDPKLRPTARLLLSDVFFVDEQCLSEGDETFDDSLFSPASKQGIQSPLGAKLSPIPGPVTRRNSASSLTSPFMSPPLPKRSGFMRSPLRRSPNPDPRDWPAWARDKHKVLQEGKSSAKKKEVLEDSLYLSDDSLPSKVASEVSAASSQRKYTTMSTTTRSPLHGLQFLSK